MTHFNPKHESLAISGLKDSIVIITGGAEGMGCAAVKLFNSHGAKVIFGDYNSDASNELVSSLASDSVHFIKMDVRSYHDNLKLFKFAMSKYGRVDHAIANAGVMEKPGWFDKRLELPDLDTAPDTFTLDVDLTGVLYFSHIACSYLAHENKGGQIHDKSLTLLSSHGGFQETPGMVVYSVAKHAIIGLMRCLRAKTTTDFPGVRVNAICPSFTEGRMTDGIKETWTRAGVPTQKPDAIATVIVGLAAAGPGSKAISYDEAAAPGVNARPSTGSVDWDDVKGRGVSGRAIFVIGYEAWDIEEGIDRTQPLWLGKDTSDLVKKAQSCLGDESLWLSKLDN
jgi:NAD(P)-dependent dehydrogenase (short-subunit alcohol dehydrogenase family)